MSCQVARVLFMRDECANYVSRRRLSICYSEIKMALAARAYPVVAPEPHGRYTRSTQISRQYE